MPPDRTVSHDLKFKTKVTAERVERVERVERLEPYLSQEKKLLKAKSL